MIKSKTTISKSELARGLGISTKTLQRDLLEHHDKILELDPTYSKHKSLLSPKIASYLLEINGLTWEEFMQNLD